jgi:antitoxin component YwqK of YwqJK toxin-antitoxin module
MRDSFSGELVQDTDNGKIVISFLNGRKDGITRFFSLDGTTLSEIPYENDVICGGVKQYYSNGKILSVIEYRNGVQHGTLTSFFENGMEQVVAQYQNGKMDGPFKAFDEFGDIVNECTYCGGQRHGKNLLYYPKSQGGGVFEVSTYKGGCLDGDKVTFYSTGEIMSVTPYVNGRAQSYTIHYSKTGEKLD